MTLPPSGRLAIARRAIPIVEAATMRPQARHLRPMDEALGSIQPCG